MSATPPVDTPGTRIAGRGSRPLLGGFISSQTRVAEGMEVTADQVVESLRKHPELLWGVKQALLQVRIAGPWEPYDASQFRTPKAIGGMGPKHPPGALARFPPLKDRMSERYDPSIAQVYRDTGYARPEMRGQMEEDYEDEITGWEQHQELINKTPWKWETEYSGCGYEATAEEACIAADRYLESKGWLLV